MVRSSPFVFESTRVWSACCLFPCSTLASDPSVFHVARTAVGFASQYTGDFPISNVDQSVASGTLPRGTCVRRIETASVYRFVLDAIVVCASIRRFSSVRRVEVESGPIRRSDAAFKRACSSPSSFVLRPFDHDSSGRLRFVVVVRSFLPAFLFVFFFFFSSFSRRVSYGWLSCLTFRR